MNRCSIWPAGSPVFNMAILVLTTLLLLDPLHVLAGDIIRINGSGTGLEMMEPLIKAYSREAHGVSFKMEKPLGSSGAIKALLAGAIDIAVVSRPLKSEEIAQGAKAMNFGKTPLVIVTQKKISLKTISTKELEDIYSGRTWQWADGKTIRVILRPNEDIDTKILRSLSPGMAEAMLQAQQRRGTLVAMTDPESDEAVSRTTGGIGTSSLTGVLAGKFPLNVLALNGMKPSRESLANGTYPLSKDIGFATAGVVPRAAAKFLEFIYSKHGRSMAETAGVVITVDNR